jgi:hypothetical protein
VVENIVTWLEGNPPERCSFGGVHPKFACGRVEYVDAVV